MSNALTVEGKVDVRCTREEAWDLFLRFGDVAALIPSVEDVQLDGDRVHARVATTLGALPVSSRVTLEVIETRDFECLKARGTSYLGETVSEQIPKNVEGVSSDSVGSLFLHLDLRPGEEEGTTAVIYSAEVEAKGRLRRIYRSILKTKVPSMMQEFADNIRGALEGPAEGADGEAAAAETPAASAEQGAGAALAERPRSWLARLVAWLLALFGLRRESP